MFRKDIEKIYTNTIMDYINKGYRIYSPSMGGSQGEIAKVDLTNDKEVIRIMLISNTSYKEKYWTDYITLTVGRNTDRLSGDAHWDIIWNEHLEIISEMYFFKIGSKGCCYGTKEEATASKKKHYDRIKERAEVVGRCSEIQLSDKAKEIVMPFMKRQYKCKSLTINQITAVKKYVYSDGVKYCVEAKGNKYWLH